MRYWLLILYSISFSCHAIELPDIGTSSNLVISLAEEQKLGESFIRELRQKAKLIDDEEINDYLNVVGRRLASYSNTPEQTFHFFVIEEPTINAFAVPGGFIVVNSGLILNTQNESELAAVLAHEISHVTQRHIARTVEATQYVPIQTIAIIIAGLLLGKSNPDAAQAAIAAASAGSLQMQINFTRSHEKEADYIGMQILADAGFNPVSMSDFFQRLQTNARYYTGQLPEFLSTHPVTTDRIADSLSRARQYSVHTREDSAEYHLMRAKLLVITEFDQHKLLKRLREMLKTGRYRDERAVHYALALVSLNMNDSQEASTQIQWLSEHDVDRTVHRLLKARLALSQNKPVYEVKQIYEEGLKIFPDDSLLSLNYVEYLLQTNTRESAITAGTVLSTLPVKTPRYYHLLAQSYKSKGEIAHYYLALAESDYLNGNTLLAIEQLEKALDLSTLDFAMASRITARYKELRQEWREIQETQRESEVEKKKDDE